MRIKPELRRNIKTIVQMSRCNGDKDYFRLTVEDASSGLTILEIQLTPESIADLVSSRITGDMATEYYHNDDIGKTHECKTVAVEYQELGLKDLDGYDDKKRNKDLKLIRNIAEERNPGWTADREEYRSKQKEGGSYKVLLRRYVSQE